MMRNARLTQASGIWSTAPQGNPHGDLRAIPWLAADLDLPTQLLDPLAHSHEPHAALRNHGVETTAVVGYLGHQRLALGLQPHFDILRPRMTPGIGENFPQNTQQLHANLRRKIPSEGIADSQRYLALGRQFAVHLHKRFDGLSERTLPLLPEVVYGAAQARARPPESFELLLEFQCHPSIL